MKHARVIWSVALVCLLGFGCRTTRFEPLEVAVPSARSAPEVEAAIMAAVLGVRTPKLSADQKKGATLSEKAAKKLFGEVYTRTYQPRGSGWFVENRKPGSMVAGLHRRSHFLRLGIAYDPQRVVTRILSSENLEQDGDQIHKRAVQWIRELESRIRLALASQPT